MMKFSISDDELKEMFGREEPESDGEAQYKEYTEDGGDWNTRRA